MVPLKAFSVITYLRISTVPLEGEWSEWASPWMEWASKASEQSERCEQMNKRSEWPNGPLSHGLRNTAHGIFLCLWPAWFHLKYKKSVTIWKIFESSSNLDQVEICCSIHLKMATVLSEHHRNSGKEKKLDAQYLSITCKPLILFA